MDKNWRARSLWSLAVRAALVPRLPSGWQPTGQAWRLLTPRGAEAAAAREKLSSPMMADLQAIKELWKRVKEAGQQARTSGDSAEAAKCFSQIQTLGDRLDQASVVLIGQKVGQALKRVAAQ